MKKKAYMAPATEFFTADIENLMVTSVKTDPNSVVQQGEESEKPTTADSRFNSIWDDED